MKKTSNNVDEWQIEVANIHTQQSSRQQNILLHINNQFDSLMKKIDLLKEVEVGDKDGYDKALELKKQVKNTHVALEKKRKELKAPMLEMGKSLDSFAKSLSEPLKIGEKAIKDKVIAYEEEIERIKQEKIEAERLLVERGHTQLNNLAWVQKTMQKIIEDMKSCNVLKEIIVLEQSIIKFSDAVTGLDLDDIGKGQGIFAISQVRDFYKMKHKVLELQEPTEVKATEVKIELELIEVVGITQDGDIIVDETPFEDCEMGNQLSMTDVLKEVNPINVGKVKTIKIPNNAGLHLTLIQEYYELSQELYDCIEHSAEGNWAGTLELHKKYVNLITRTENLTPSLGGGES